MNEEIIDASNSEEDSDESSSEQSEKSESSFQMESEELQESSLQDICEEIDNMEQVNQSYASLRFKKNHEKSNKSESGLSLD